MNTDKALARLRVTLKCDDDIGLRKGGAQKFQRLNSLTFLKARSVESCLVDGVYLPSY
jgi:hypothetical protein